MFLTLTQVLGTLHSKGSKKLKGVICLKEDPLKCGHLHRSWIHSDSSLPSLYILIVKSARDVHRGRFHSFSLTVCYALTLSGETTPYYTVFKIAIFARHRVGQNSSMIALKTANSGPIRGAKNSFSLHLWVCKNNPT